MTDQTGNQGGGPSLDKPEDKPQDQPAAAPRAAKKAAKGMEKRVWIILEENDDIPPTGLFVSHNGTPFLIATGEPVAVPERVLNVLNDAIMQVPITNPQTKQVVGYRPRMRYPYRLTSDPNAGVA